MLRLPVEVAIKIRSLDHLKDILQQADEIIKGNPDMRALWKTEVGDWKEKLWYMWKEAGSTRKGTLCCYKIHVRSYCEIRKISAPAMLYLRPGSGYARCKDMHQLLYVNEENKGKGT